ncbi:MAG: hypothetical protein ACFBRM_10715 [Pikeienuella sp.]
MKVFLAQMIWAGALFWLIESIEIVLRSWRPGWPHIVYWAAKTVVGLPIVMIAAWAALEGNWEPDVAALLAGTCLAAAAALWAYGPWNDKDD